MSLESLISRIRDEYREMPGLQLTVAQACRLWQMEAPICQLVLEKLVLERFLFRTENGAYVASNGSRQLKADLSRGALRRPA